MYLVMNDIHVKTIYLLINVVFTKKCHVIVLISKQLIHTTQRLKFFKILIRIIKNEHFLQQ